MGDWFTVEIIVAQTDYLPSGEAAKFSDVYRHIKSINNNEYIHSFYNRYSEIHKLRKTEIAIKNRWNLLLALMAMRSLK